MHTKLSSTSISNFRFVLYQCTILTAENSSVLNLIRWENLQRKIVPFRDTNVKQHSTVVTAFVATFTIGESRRLLPTQLVMSSVDRLELQSHSNFVAIISKSQKSNEVLMCRMNFSNKTTDFVDNFPVCL